MENVTKSPEAYAGKTESSDGPFRSLNSLTLQDAQNRIHGFRHEILGLTNWPAKTSKTKACMIKLSELANLLKFDHNALSVDGIRCYLALRYDGDKGEDVISLVMVATKYDAKTDTYVDLLHDENGIPAIFDYTTPCPDTCDTKSPLYNLSLKK